MFDFMTNIRSCKIIIKPLRIIFNNYFAFCFTFIFSFDILLLEVFIKERLYEWVELLLLIVSCWSSWIYKYPWTHDSCEDFRFLYSFLMNEQNYEKVKIHSFVIVSGRRKFHGAKINLTIYHLHLSVTSNADIY